jgi:hypothetical protein
VTRCSREIIPVSETRPHRDGGNLSLFPNTGRGNKSVWRVRPVYARGANDGIKRFSLTGHPLRSACGAVLHDPIDRQFMIHAALLSGRQDDDVRFIVAEQYNDGEITKSMH